MRNVVKSLILLTLSFCLQARAQTPATIRGVAVTGGAKATEIEISISQPVFPQAQLLSNPDRLVLDFRFSVSGPELKDVPGVGSVKGVRASQFSSDPPVTRVVVDLTSPQSFQLFPSRYALVIKIAGGGVAAAPSPQPVAPAHQKPVSLPRQAVPVNPAPANTAPATATQFTTEFEVVTGPPQPVEEPAKPVTKMRVKFENGQLSIWADKATLAEVLYEVHRLTGADIPVPAGAEQELVAVQLGPGPARDVLATLLNGSRFNFVMIGSDSDPSQLDSVILTPRPGTGAPPPVAYQANVPAPAGAAPAPPTPPPPDEGPDSPDDSSNPQPN